MEAAGPKPTSWLRENLSTILIVGTLGAVTIFSFLTRNHLNREVRPPGAEGAAGERFLIVFMTPADEVAEKAYDQLLRSFERRHPDIDVKFDIATGGRTFDSIIATKMSARAAPDVFFFEDEPFAEFARENAFLPLDPYIERDEYDMTDFFKKAQEEFELNGVTYGLCQGWGAIVLLYNKDIFEERGVTYSDDWTWKDFDEAANKLTFDRDGDGDIDVYGYRGRRNFSHACIAIWSAGGEVLNKDKTKWTLTTPEVRRAFQWWCDVYRRQPPVTPEGAETHDAVFATMSDPFMEGRVAMAELAAYACGKMRGHTRFRWGIGYQPKANPGPDGKPLPRRTRHYGDSYVVRNKYPPNWMVNDGLLTRSVIDRMSLAMQRELTGADDASSLSDAELQKRLKENKLKVSDPALTRELLGIWNGGDEARASMNEKLRHEMTRRDKAWELLKHLAGTPGQRLIARLGRSTPGRKSVARGRWFNRPDTPYDESRMVDAIKFSHLQPITPGFGDVQTTWQKYVDRIFVKEGGLFKRLSPDDALEKMEVELNKQLAASLKRVGKPPRRSRNLPSPEPGGRP